MDVALTSHSLEAVKERGVRTGESPIYFGGLLKILSSSKATIDNEFSKHLVQEYLIVVRFWLRSGAAISQFFNGSPHSLILSTKKESNEPSPVESTCWITCSLRVVLLGQTLPYKHSPWFSRNPFLQETQIYSPSTYLYCAQPSSKSTNIWFSKY